MTAGQQEIISWARTIWAESQPMAVAYVLAFARAAGACVLAPLLGALRVPLAARLTLAGAIAVCCVHDVGGMGGTDVAGVLLHLAAEFVQGAVIGAIAALPLLMLQSSGVLLSVASGLGAAQVFDPAADTESDVVARVTWWSASAAFVASGGLERTAGVLVRSYTERGVGMNDQELAPQLSRVLAVGSDAVLGIALPGVMAMVLGLLVAGLAGRLWPRVQASAAALPVVVACGLALLVWNVGRMPGVVGALLDGAPNVKVATR